MTTMKVLFVIPYTMSRGGTEAVMMNLIRNFTNDVHVDVVQTKSSRKGLYDDELISLGKGSVFYVPSEKRFLAYLSGLKEIMATGNYDIVHAHFLDDRSYFPLKIAKKCGVQVRIAHIHDTLHVSGSSLPSRIVAGYLNRIGRKKLQETATSFFACSSEAGKDYFPFLKDGRQSFRIVRNAIDLDRYSFNQDRRSHIRKELGISESTFVLGQVGRFSLGQKNQLFTIRLFSRLLSVRPDSHLVLLGAGADILAIKALIEKLNLKAKTSIVTNADSASYYSAFDCFILPSFYEGLCVAAVEAQCNGLPCVLSNQMTKETVLCPNVVQISLNDSLDTWLSSIIGLKRTVDSRQILEKEGYDVKLEAREVERTYNELLLENDRTISNLLESNNCE